MSVGKKRPATTRSAAGKSRRAGAKSGAKSAVKSTGKRPAPAKKTAAKKTAAKKTAAKKTAASKTAAEKTSRSRKPSGGANSRRMADSHALFEPLTEGERADALRYMMEDKRLATMAKVGRYRIIAAEPLVFKPDHDHGGRRIARLVAYDYATDRCVEANVDLDDGLVLHLQVTRSQPMLSREEELAAIDIALSDERLNSALALGDEPQAAMQYWSRRDSDLSFARRSAAVLFGQIGARPSLVAVVDLLDSYVAEIVPAEQW